jgi:Zn-dependent peptidase ImmA (M78 family)
MGLSNKRKEEIAVKAKELQIEVYKKLKAANPRQDPSPYRCLDPELICEHLGIRYESISEIGYERFTGGRMVGLMDRQAKKIVVAGGDPWPQMRFTAAHEIGHWVLHGDLTMHRDRPNIHGDIFNQNLSSEELEANYFACYLLMPRRMIIKEFVKRFGPQPLEINDLSAHWLRPDSPDAVFRSSAYSLDLYIFAAGCHHFNHRSFKSIAEQFDVSVSAMARRLKELKLIKWP